MAVSGVKTAKASAISITAASMAYTVTAADDDSCAITPANSAPTPIPAAGASPAMTPAVADQAALYGVLAEIEALGLELLELRRTRD